MESPFYRELNKSLRCRNREELKGVFFPALKLLLHALKKLPRVRMTVCVTAAVCCTPRELASGVSRSEVVSVEEIFATKRDRPGDCLVRVADS